MATSRRTPHTPRERPRAPSDRAARLLERTGIALAIGLLVARPLFPSEDADEGTGLVIVVLWGVVAFLWAAAQMARRELRWYSSWIDWFGVMLAGAVILSTFWADSPRPAINMAGESCGLVLSFLLIRQLFREPPSQRLLLVAMLATAFSLAAYGIYQAFWGLESLRAEYGRDRNGILDLVGIAPGSPQEQLFKNRLMSHEPFATFALANSLAGFLVAWITVGLGWLLDQFLPLSAEKRSSSAGVPRRVLHGLPIRVLGGVAMLTTLICLILTQSRSAYAGFLLQCLGMALIYGRSLVAKVRLRASNRRLWGACLLAVTVTMVGVIWAAVERGKMDEKILTEATKSLGYRWQYWRATARLIRDHIGVGVGPGNFRGHYLRYKLPESSEEIADPHNMVLEVWATSGVFAVVSLLAVLVIAINRSLTASSEQGPWEGKPDWLLLGSSGIVGFALGGALAPSEPTLYVWLMIAWGGAAAVFALGFPASLARPSVVGCALAGLAIHLMGAGGIGMPAVANSLWVLSALALNMTEGHREPIVVRSQPLVRGLLLVVSIVPAFFGLLVLQPVSASQSANAVGRRLLSRGDWAGAEAEFRAAASLDPLSAEPWLEVSRIHYVGWQRGHGRAAEDQFDLTVRALEQASRLAPTRLDPIRLLADLLESRAKKEPQFWSRASEAYERCVRMYPTHAPLRARLANAWWESGRHDQARVEMARALELDTQTPHLDKKLDAVDRELIHVRLAFDKTLDLGAP